LANVGESGESLQNGLANVGKSGESRICLKNAILRVQVLAKSTEILASTGTCKIPARVAIAYFIHNVYGRALSLNILL
jgi:hypothetical protein